MKTIILLIVFISAPSFAVEKIKVLNADAARATSYTSLELAHAVPMWVVDGNVVTQAEARDLVLNQGKISCGTWLMNYSDNKELSKTEIQNGILVKSKSIPLWKNVSGLPIYIDEKTSFGLSFICATKNADNEFVDVVPADFKPIFKGIYKF